MRIAAILGAMVLATSVAFTVSTPAAHATSCSTGFFYIQPADQPSIYIVDEGHNNRVQTIANDQTTSFCEVPISGSWFELSDNFIPSECLNLGSDGFIYMDSCAGTTPEQWFKSGHTFENRHSGSLMTWDAADLLVYVSGCCSTKQQWATPGV